MGRPRRAARHRWISEFFAALFALVALVACSSDHHVSPWGEAGRPVLAPFAERADLTAKLEEIDRDASALGLTLDWEERSTLGRGGEPVVFRAYVGRDALGRATTAARVATPRAIVMAAGPLDARDTRDLATTLLRDPKPGADLNHDGAPDAVLASATGALEIWRFDELGSRRYDVEIEGDARELRDVDGDGTVDLAGGVVWSDAIGGRFDDVAVFDGARYSDKTVAARAFHDAALKSLSKREGVEGDVARLRRALATAFHRVMAGEAKKTVLSDLDKERVPPELMTSFVAQRARIDAIAAR